MSSISKAPPSSNYDISTEESGWTMYFDDFFNDHHHHHNNKCSMSLSAVASSSSHIVSDATSLVEKKNVSSEHVEKLSTLNEKDKRSSFKRRKNIITALVDEALEDTATSPLNSPKEKGNTSGQKDEQKELSYSNNGRDSDCTEQKKGGLCVVPLSMDILCWKEQITKHETRKAWNK